MKNEIQPPTNDPEEFYFPVEFIQFFTIPKNRSFYDIFPIYENIIEQLNNLTEMQECHITPAYPSLINGDGLYVEYFPN
jgi:hypothetical protein